MISTIIEAMPEILQKFNGFHKTPRDGVLKFNFSCRGENIMTFLTFVNKKNQNWR